MQVELLVSRAGPGISQNAGDIVEVTSDEAARMIAAGQASPVRAVKPEKAVRRAKVEKASK
jgi:hypothetical protein